MIERERPRRFKALVTYADAWQGHRGTVYLATGWTFAGETEPSEVWVDEEGRMGSRIGALPGRTEAGNRRTRSRSAEEMRELGFESRGKWPKLRFVKVLR